MPGGTVGVCVWAYADSGPEADAGVGVRGGSAPSPIRIPGRVTAVIGPVVRCGGGIGGAPNGWLGSSVRIGREGTPGGGPTPVARGRGSSGSSRCGQELGVRLPAGAP